MLKNLLKVQVGDVYIQVPADEPENIQLIIDFLKYAKDWFKKEEAVKQ